MKFRSFALALIVALIAALAVFNWSALATSTAVSLGVTEIQAPLGVLMLGLTVLLSAFFIGYVLWMQGTVLMAARRHAKEMQVQRDLADKAEASRFTELRTVLEELHAKNRRELLERMDLLERRLTQRFGEDEGRPRE